MVLWVCGVVVLLLCSLTDLSHPSLPLKIMVADPIERAYYCRCISNVGMIIAVVSLRMAGRLVATHGASLYSAKTTVRNKEPTRQPHDSTDDRTGRRHFLPSTMMM